MDILEISDLENQLVLLSIDKYDICYKNTKEALKLLSEGFEHVDSKAFVFKAFYFQLEKSLHLSLLSILRWHDVQASMMLRYAIESSTMAAYSLSRTSTDEYLFINERGLATVKSKVAKKCYDWLTQNYFNYSEKLKSKKDMINMFATHSNLFNAFKNFDKENFEFHFFDDLNEDDVKGFLWNIGNTAILIMQMISDVSKKYNYISFIEDYEQRLNEVIRNNMLIREDFLSRHEYSYWIGK